MKKKTLRELGNIYNVAPETLCRWRKAGAVIESPSKLFVWLRTKPGRKSELLWRMARPPEAVRIASAFYEGPSVCDMFRAAIRRPE